MKKFKLTRTHNLQDFANGDEPPELNKTYWTSTPSEDAEQDVKSGFTVIITDVEDDTHADV